MTPPRVVVVGAGITGLSAAFTLHEDARRRGAPLSLKVLDAAPRPGGHVQTTRVDGFLVEAGPNGFLSREPHTLALIDALGLAPRLVEARPEAKRRFILRGGRLCQVPDSPATLFTSPALSWRGKLRVLCEPFAPAPPADVEETVFDFARRRIGREAADTLVDTAVSGISAGDSRRLSVSAQFPLMTDLERDHGSLVRAMVARRKRGVPTPTLLSFDEGMGTLVAALVRRLGLVVQCNTRLQAVERAGGAWRLRVDGGGVLDADHVVLAVPASGAALVVEAMDPVLSAWMRGVDYAGVVVVALGYRLQDLTRPLDGYGYLVTRSEGLATLGVVWESTLFPDRAPEGTALLRVVMGGSRRPDVVNGSDEWKVELARHELQAAMGIRANPCHTSVFTWPRAIAQFTLGHNDRRECMRHRLRGHAGLAVCGTSYDGVSFNHAVESGRATAHHLGEQLWGDHRRASPLANRPEGA